MDATTTIPLASGHAPQSARPPVDPNPVAYLDYAASAPMRPEVAEAMAPWLLADHAGNPSSIHRAGRQARTALEDARDRIADALGVHPLDVLFTSGATEANNLAIAGALQAVRTDWPTDYCHVLAGTTDHSSILEPLTHTQQGPRLSLLALDPQTVGHERCGVIDAQEVADAITPQTALVVGTAVTSELGAIQPLEDWMTVIDDHAAQCYRPWVHVDATQAIGKIPLGAIPNRATSLAMSAHKLGGPQGVGVLVLDRAKTVVSPILGGGQERGIRSGTIPVALCVGAGVAVHQAVTTGQAEMDRLATLKTRLLNGLAGSGWDNTVHPAYQVASCCYLTAPNTDTEMAIMALDRAGVFVSAGSACQSGAIKTSPVREAINLPPHTATLRLSMGWATTEADIDLAIKALLALPVGGKR